MQIQMKLFFCNFQTMWLDLSFRAEKENEYLKTLIFNFDQKTYLQMHILAHCALKLLH